MQLETWLFEEAWPLWRDHGFDHRNAGFHEALDPATLTCPASFRRLRVLTRQIYVFSRAARYGLPGAEELVARGVDMLLRQARQPDGGYAWRFALDGSVTDQRRDLYDHGFVLLALASAATLGDEVRLRAEALRLIAWLDSWMRHPSGGYREALPETGEPRRQNGHMHLLEAMLAAWEAFGDEIFLDRAQAIVDLFLDRLFDWRTGTLPELFDEALAPLPPGHGNQVEPGHHAEWISLLSWHGRFQRAAGRANPGASERATTMLWNFALRFGRHREHDAFVDALTADGGVLSAGARLWPQTERLKSAALCIASDPQAVVDASSALSPYLDHPVKGLWHERRCPRGLLSGEPAPASSLYHLTGAILFAGQSLRGLASEEIRASGPVPLAPSTEMRQSR